MRILSIDPGRKYIGLAISDSTGTIATPLATICHRSYREDASSILKVAGENKVEQIVIGQSFDENGEASFAGRLSIRLGEAIKNISNLPIEFWDEAFTTQEARTARIRMGSKKKNRSGHLDSLAAAVLLQSYLDRNL